MVLSLLPLPKKCRGVGMGKEEQKVGWEEKDPEQKSTSLFAGESEIER